MYYKEYPWVYDNVSKDWLYLRGSSDGKIYAYRASSKAWEEFDANQTVPVDSEKFVESNTKQISSQNLDNGSSSEVDETSNNVDNGSSFDIGETFYVVGNKSNLTFDLNSSLNLQMIWVDPGTFTMGSVENENYQISSDETPQHDVTITNGFYLAQYETTQSQFSQIVGYNPSHYSAEENWINWRNRPVENLEYSQIEAFLKTLNDKIKMSVGWSFQLPSEAEWEYACRAGTTTPYPWGQTIDENKANYRAKNWQYTMEVDSHGPNPWGFYDMIGNVSEWVADGRRTYTSSSATDPSFEEYIRGEKVWMCRGGNFQDIDFVNGGMWVSPLRSASRIRYAGKHYTIGFRIALKKTD